MMENQRGVFLYFQPLSSETIVSSVSLLYHFAAPCNATGYGRGEGGNTSHPPLCFVVKQNIGEVARNDGGVNSFRILEIPADA